MPSGIVSPDDRAFGGGGEGIEPPEAGARLGPQGGHLGRAGAVPPAAAPLPRQTLRGARAGALSAMQPAAPIGHGRLAAASPGAGPGVAARSGEVVPGRIAVVEPPAAGRRERGGAARAGGGVFPVSRHGLSDRCRHGVHEMFYSTSGQVSNRRHILASRCMSIVRVSFGRTTACPQVCSAGEALIRFRLNRDSRGHRCRDDPLELEDLWSN